MPRLPRKVDREVVEESLQLRTRRRRYGILDGYAIADCRDPRVRRVLEFLVPLLYPEKPTRVTITVGNTIFGALSGERPVDWGVVV